jgi:hypothetical protein
VATSSTEFFDGLAKRLGDKGFDVNRNIEKSPYHLDVVGFKTKFQFAMGGLPALNRLTRCVLAGRLDGADVSIAEDFFAKCLDYALAKRPLGGGVLTVSVMVCDEVQEAVKQWARGGSFKRNLAATGFPMVFSLRNHEAYYSEKGPLVLGRAFFPEFRKMAAVVLDSKPA